LHRQICAIAAKVFGEARTFTPETEYEMGWPGACNFMMKEALFHVEQYFQDDILLLEPDATPLVPNWYERIKQEWAVTVERGLEFMGGYVARDIPHMSGNGVYGRYWRSVAPKLAHLQNIRGWDTWAADEMLPFTQFSDLIQHIQWSTHRPEYGGPSAYESMTLD